MRKYGRRGGRVLAARIGAVRTLSLVALLLATSAQERLLAQQQDQEQHQDAPKTDPRTYQTCLDRANAVHAASHAAECQRLAETTQKNHANCLVELKLPPAYCDASYPARDSSANCTLPAGVATVIDAALEQARYRCARENEAALRKVRLPTALTSLP
jgi:hypothetical protein